MAELIQPKIEPRIFCQRQCHSCPQFTRAARNIPEPMMAFLTLPTETSK